MDRSHGRRALLGALAAGATAGGLSDPVRSYLRRFAPLSGGVSRAARDDRPSTVDSPHGPARLRYDDHSVARVTADDEMAAYFAVGYAHGADRLFQMDLQRRQLRGRLSAVVGEATLASDRTHVRLDFVGAAEATWERARGTEVAELVEAYCEGVNRAREELSLPVEFELLDAEPAPWTPVDVALGLKLISWQLTGAFPSLHRAALADAVDPAAVDELLPARLDHDATILGHEGATEGWEPGGDGSAVESRSNPPGATAVDPAVERSLSAIESPPWAGSNSWVVGPDATATDGPILANDPHLALQAPPVWYEQVVDAADYRVRGVAFPGLPFVVIGENDAGTWGFTNAGCDVLDCYTYETRADGAEYRYGDEWRAFETETRTIPVAGGDDRSVTVRKSVHGPVIARDDAASGGGVAGDADPAGEPLGIAWTGFSGTRTLAAAIDLGRASGPDEVKSAVRRFDEPTQSLVYAGADGAVRYRVVGAVPIRRTDGDPVAADRVFDGSAREGEWSGYEPYGTSSWEGFIPFEEMPHIQDPPYIGTANQRIVDDADYPHYFAATYSAPSRGVRLWDRLDALVDGADDVTPADLRELQRDVRSERAERFIAVLAAERDDLPERLRSTVDDLLAWDRRMTPDSSAALLFARFLDHYRSTAVRPVLADRLGDSRDPDLYLPNDWVLAGLDPDSRWFPEGRTAAVAAALERALDEIDSEGWERYGDVNQTTIDHPFDRPGLNYPRYETGGSGATLSNVGPGAGWGSSWLQVCPAGEPGSRCVLPGGNDGSPFSDQYADQLRAWARGEYKPMDRERAGEVAVRFQPGGQGADE